MASKSSRSDPAWKYGKEKEVPGEGGKKGYKYIECNFCSKVIKGGVKRMKEHLACTHNDSKPCENVPADVKEEMRQYLETFQKKKHDSQRCLEENVESGAYYNSNNPSQRVDPSPGNFAPSDTSRGVRGPMDRYMATGKEDDEGPVSGAKMTPATVKEQRNQLSLDVGRFFYENGIPFNVARSPSFISMMRGTGHFGRGYKTPTPHELRTWILREEVKTTTMTVDGMKSKWKETGVSILSDGWSDMRNRSLINFLVNNQHGTVFLKTVDASDCIKNAEKLFLLLDGVVEEVGEDVVVQVVTDNASAYKAAGALLMEKRKSLYWTPCAAHCIDLMLEKIGGLTQQKNALIKAKKVSNYIYNHQWVLSLARKHLKKDLLRPAATRFATAFLTLQSMYDLKQPLQSMFVSGEWSNCAWAKKHEGREVKKIVMDDRIFWPSVVYSLKTTKPLVQVLRMVDGEKTPAMGFIYGAMDECKEKIAKNFNGEESYYKEIWDIIDTKWDLQMHRDLHAAAYYLNPQFRWSPNVSVHPEIKRGLYNCMERLLKDDAVYRKVDLQLDAYTHQQGLFGYRGSMNTYMTRPPVIWWSQFGDEAPELKSFAVRILGLTCSASACERNWSTFNQVHTKRRNRLTTDRLEKLVYVMYNRKLKQKSINKNSLQEDVDPFVVEDENSDNEWIDEPCDDDEGEDGDDGDDEFGDEAGSSLLRKRKSVEVNLIDEDSEDELDGL